jgi:hypothetical protein
MATQVPTALSDILDQAREVREQYPAFYAFLVTRERALDRVLAGIPHPSNVEAWLTFSAGAHARRLLNLPPGMCELVRLAERRDGTADGRAR